MLIERASLYNLAHFWNPLMDSKSIRGSQISLEKSLMGGEENSDQGDPYRDSGRLCPVPRRVMGNHMFHHRVFRHVLHKVRLLGKKKTNHMHLSTLDKIFNFPSLNFNNVMISNSLRCMSGRTCYSSRPWRFWWRVQTGGFAARQSPNRHGSSRNIWRACPCCAASGGTSAGKKEIYTNSSYFHAALLKALQSQFSYPVKVGRIILVKHQEERS